MISYRLPSSLEKDIDVLEGLIKKHMHGIVSKAELKARRVPFGVYEQREADTYMIRIRCPAGLITPRQLEKVAEISSRYGAKMIHLTTRQELQIHYVKLDHVVTVIRNLRQIGLASRGGGGNTVRNIIAPADAGVDPQEVFDVTPYVVSLTTRLITEEDSWTLPRKLKIAFSGSSQDKGNATISDIGFIAVKKGEKKGFRVYVAGGLGAHSQAAHLLFDFIDDDEVYNIARAVKTLFWKYGNRKNKHAARLRFLWQSLGEAEFKRRLMQELEALKEEKNLYLEVEEIHNTAAQPGTIPEEIHDSSDFELWKKRFLHRQKQEGLFSVEVPIEMGFLENEKAIELARFLKLFGDNCLRVTKEQNFQIRNIPERYLTNLYNLLKGIVKKFHRPFILDKIVSCAGATTCQLGICHSRGAAKELRRLLVKNKLNLDQLSDITINISGCPNACGQHPVADLGFFGKASRKDGRLYPAYNVVAGGVVREGHTQLAEKVGEVSAKDLPKLVLEFLDFYLSIAGDYKNFEDYIRHGGKEDLKKMCRRYETIPSYEEKKDNYSDWCSNELFSLSGRGSGECSAGLFDLIGMDLKNIQRVKENLSKLFDLESKGNISQKQRYLLELVFYSARMLLITRAVEPKTESEVYDRFMEHFIQTGLVDGCLEDVVVGAREKNFKVLLEREKKVYALEERVKFLYENMDNSFQFKVPGEEKVNKDMPQASPKLVKDLRGISCPMNFVKTKLELSRLSSKEILEIFLDDGEPIDNVPGSVREEGHKILKQEKVDDYWKVTIQKK